MANPSKITTSRARPKLGRSAQARWQKKMQRLGRCRSCGVKRPPELAQLCRACAKKASDYMAKYRANKKETYANS
jgi:hypothetical protein